MAETATEFIRAQHETIRRLFADVDAATGDSRKDPWELLVRLLAVHETAEEMVIYPAIRRVDGGDAIVEARTQEEDEAKKILTDLEKLDPSSAEFEAAFRPFRSAVLGHAEAEEAEVLPLLASVKDQGELETMTKMLTVAEGMAPTHPHKSAPESATGNLLVGPFVAMVDRVRDAFRG
jgi:hemerythrin superfamily protein